MLPFLLLTAWLQAPPESHPQDALLLVPDAAWCWFADPRALRSGRATWVGWVDSGGDVCVGKREGESWSTATLHPGFEADDHACPALWADAEGRMHVFYSRHNGSGMFERHTLHPGDPSEWTPERVLRLYGERPGRRTTYPNPVAVPSEGRLYLLWRGDDWKPTFSWSEDEGETWVPAQTLVAPVERDPSNRPYVKVAPHGGTGFHLAFTDGHPRLEEKNSIRYLCYEEGRLRRADGTPLASLEECPVDIARTEVVYDGASPGGRAWVWDVAEDGAGRPVIVFSMLPSESEHHYGYARWNGECWDVHPITPAGGWFPQTPPGKVEPEPHYSGGIVLDHTHPEVVYLSRRVGEHFEIERWETSDGGASWSSRPLTRGSSHDQVRPVYVRNARPGGLTLLWMEVDRYRHYTDYRTGLRAASLERD